MQAPALAVGDGALGFWKAVRDVWPETREQRCWFHKLGNVIDKLPKRLQAKHPSPVQPPVAHVTAARKRVMPSASIVTTGLGPWSAS